MGKKVDDAYALWCARTAKSAGDRPGEQTPEATGLFAPTAASLDEDHFLGAVGFPGSFPFTRGIQPNMYRGRRWTMRQYAGFGTAAETNRRYRYLLSQGTTGLSVAFDLPTQMGRDSDHPVASGEVGRVGVAIDSVDDMDRLFDDIPLGEVSTSMTINATAHILLACYLEVARRRGIPWTELRGTVQNDVLKEYIARGTYIYPPSGALRITTDIMEFCAREVPKWNTISISGYHIREAGSTAAQELALTFANGITYVEAAIARGMDPDTFGPRLAFFFNAHNNFLEEVAKYRAARRMWATIMRDRFGAKKEQSWMLRFHTQTAGSTLTAQQPLNNVVRTTLQALAAVCGGTQSLHTNAYDEALGLPTEEAATVALRTQQVLSEESGIAAVIDPFGGSYAVEAMTDRLEAEACELIRRLEADGGMLRAISAGTPQRWIEDSAYRYQRDVEAGTERVVGVNCYAESGTSPVDILRIPPELETEQRGRLVKLRADRDPTAHAAALAELRAAAAGNANVMPAVCLAVRNLATLGEISDTLREVFGEYRHVST